MDVKPWDYFLQEHVSDQEQEARYNICQECPFFMNVTKQCKKCGCFMVAKTAIKNAVCPEGKW